MIQFLIFWFIITFWMIGSYLVIVIIKHNEGLETKTFEDKLNLFAMGIGSWMVLILILIVVVISLFKTFLKQK